MIQVAVLAHELHVEQHFLEHLHPIANRGFDTDQLDVVTPGNALQPTDEFFGDGALEKEATSAGAALAGGADGAEEQEHDRDTGGVHGDHGVGFVGREEIDHLDGKLFIDYLKPLRRQMITRKMVKMKRELART